MMTMQPGLDDMTKQRILQAKALCKEVRGGMSRIHDVHGFDIRLKSTSAHNSNTHIRFGLKLANGVLYILVNISLKMCVHAQTASLMSCSTCKSQEGHCAKYPKHSRRDHRSLFPHAFLQQVP